MTPYSKFEHAEVINKEDSQYMRENTLTELRRARSKKFVQSVKINGKIKTLSEVIKISKTSISFTKECCHLSIFTWRYQTDSKQIIYILFNWCLA